MTCGSRELWSPELGSRWQRPQKIWTQKLASCRLRWERDASFPPQWTQVPMPDQGLPKREAQRGREALPWAGASRAVLTSEASTWAATARLSSPPPLPGLQETGAEAGLA